MDDSAIETLEIPVAEEVNEVPIVNDPKIYFARFLESPQYQEGFEEFYLGKSLVLEAEANKELKKKVFLESDGVEMALNNFYNKQQIKFDPSKYTPEIISAWNSYTATIRKMRVRGRLMRMDREEMQAYDALRSTLHRKAAELMVAEGMVPNIKVGRKLLQYMTIGEGLEDIGVIDATTSQRNAYVLGGKIPS